MYNRVILIGNLTRDVELRYLQSGMAVAKIGIATNRKFKAQNGEQKEEVCFIDVTLFGRTGEIANQYLKKGSKVLIEGRLVLEQWTDQNGQKRSKHSVTADTLQMLDSKGGGGSSGGDDYESYAPSDGFKGGDYSSNEPQGGKKSGGSNIPEIDISDEEIPF